MTGRLTPEKKKKKRLKQDPGKWIPAYTQVTFSPQLRYSDALKNAMRQESIMQEIMAMPGIEEKWDSEEIEKAVLERLTS